MPENIPPGVINQESVIDRLLGFFGVTIKVDLPRSAGESRRFPAGIPRKPTEPRGAEPRATVPPMMGNLVARPRKYAGVDLTPFDQLRNLAKFDLVNIAKEDVKGQILGMGWGVRVKEEYAGDGDEFKDDVDDVRRAIEMPDPLAALDFDAWLNRAVDEILVTDALSLYPRFSRGGDPIGLEQVDGATIVPLLDDLGRPPIPPAAAYQQIVHGLPETEFVLPTGPVSGEELWYLPRNRSSFHPYGSSPTEGVLLTVNLAMRGLMHDLSWHTEGSVPDSIWSFTNDKTPDQLDEYQIYFDDLLSGRADRRSGGMRFMAPGTLHETKERKWQYDFNEWLGRVIAWSFGVSPLPIAKMINRATAEMAEQSSLESGVKPLAKHIAMIFNRYISRVLNKPHIEFAWDEKETDDTATVVDKQTKIVGVGGTTLNELRVDNGRDPYPVPDDWPEGVPHWGDRPFVVTGSGPVFIDEVARGEIEPTEGVAKIDPQRIQRAFLEVPVITVDELRVAIGAPALGGEKGAEFVTIAQQGVPGAPPPKPSTNADGDDTGFTGVVPVDEAPSSDPPAFPIALAAFAGRVRNDLRKWRRLLKSRGLAKRFTSTCIVPLSRKLIEADETVEGRLMGITSTTVAKSEPDPTAGFVAVEEAFASVVDGWLADQLPAVLEWALGFLGGRGEATEEIPSQADVVDAVDKLAKRPDTAVVLGRPVAIVKARATGKSEAPALAKQFPTEPPIDPSSMFDSLLNVLLGGHEAGQADTLGAIGVALDVVPADALLFAQERAAELVGMKWVGGQLVTNPDPQFAISPALREAVKAKVEQAISQGWSPDKLTSELRSDFGDWRAQTIARTETGFAYGEGAADVYEEAEVELVEILDGPGCLPNGHAKSANKASGRPGVVEENSEANGQVWTIAQYRAHKLGHPNCVRAAVPHLPELPDEVPS